MKQLIPMDDYGIFADTHDTARANSLMVAKMFSKRHDNVLNSIRSIMSDDDDGFSALNFKEATYIDEQGKKRPCYCMTRDGFTLLAMGFTGKRAMQFKKAYIRRFNEMERFIQTLVATRKDYPLLTENVKLLHENPKPYHFSNEADLINRLVVGMSAKEFRAKHSLLKGESIRPHLTDEQIWLMNALQKADIGLMISEPNFEARKRYLEWYRSKLLERRAIA